MKQTFILVLFLMLLGCSSDSSPEDGLPKETQTGANTFGCLIDGKLYKPRCEEPSIVFPQWGMIVWGSPMSYNYNEIQVRDLKSDYGFNMLLHIENINSLGVNSYIINESNGLTDIDGFRHNYLQCIIHDKITNTYKKYVSYENSGIIKILKLGFVSENSIDGYIMSGTFHGFLNNILDPNDKIEITNGRFDINTSTVIYKEFP